MTQAAAASSGIGLTISQVQAMLDQRDDRRREARKRIRTAFAAALRPPRRSRPSEWIANNITITREMNKEKPGPYRVDDKPWLRDVLDCLYDNPHKRGMVVIKPAQVGLTTAAGAMVLHKMDEDPGAVLHLVDTDDKVAEISRRYYRAMVKANARLHSRWKSESKEKKTSKIDKMMFPGGEITLAGSGSISAVIGLSYPDVILDEYDTTEAMMPKEQGSLFMLALGRIDAFPTTGRVIVFSHPRKAEAGVEELYTRVTDQRDWVIDCPHCSEMVQLRWSLVDHQKFDLAGKPIPAYSVLKCPHCKKIITDAERARALMPRRTHVDRGGTGRFASTMKPEEASLREFVGLRISGLANPSRTVSELAAKFAMIKDEADRTGFFGLMLGEAPPSSDVTNDPADVDAAVSHAMPVPRVCVPGRDPNSIGGVYYVTCGIDVQKPVGGKLTFVTTTSAWDAIGNQQVVNFSVLHGYDALRNFIVQFRVPTFRDEKAGDDFSIDAVGIDVQGSYQGELMDFTRQSIRTWKGRDVVLCAFAFKPHMNEQRDAWLQLAPEAKRQHPTKPHWGLHPHYYWVSREGAVTRAMQRLQEKRLLVLCEAPTDFKSHMMANKRHLVRGKGFKPDKTIWVKMPGERDDYFMSLLFGELAAVKACEVDTLYGRVFASQYVTPELVSPVNAPSWIAGGVRPTWVS